MTFCRVFVLSLLAGCSLTSSLTGGSSSSGPVGPKPSGSAPAASGGEASAAGPSAVETAPLHQGEWEPPSHLNSTERRQWFFDNPRPGYTDCRDREAYARAHNGDTCDPHEPAIVGLTVDDATKKVAQILPNKRVRVITGSEFDEACKPDHVCSVDRGWWTGATVDVTFVVNRKLDIGPPAD